jgi:hypothetical protein
MRSFLLISNSLLIQFIEFRHDLHISHVSSDDGLFGPKNVVSETEINGRGDPLL